MEWRGVKQTALRYTSLAVACLNIGSSYANNAYSIYLNALKETFGFTQTQLEVIISLGRLGQVSALVGALVYRKFGMRVATSLGYLSGVAYLLMWTACYTPEFYHDHFYIFAIYSCLGGAGGAMVYIVAISCNIVNYRVRKRGTISGVLSAMSSAGVALIIVLYDGFFANGYEPQSQNLGGFFLTLGIAFIVLNTLAMICYQYSPEMGIDIEEEDFTQMRAFDFEGAMGMSDIEEDNDEEDEVIPTNFNDLVIDLSGSMYKEKLYDDDLSEEESLMSGYQNPLQTEDLAGPKLFLRCYFNCVCWSAAILIALEYNFAVNITVIMSSFHYDGFNLILPLVNPALGTLSKPLIGLTQDLLRTKVPASLYILILANLSVLMYILSVWLAYAIAEIIVTAVIVDLAGNTAITLAPVLLIDLYGKKNFAINMSLVMVTSVILVVPLSLLFGLAYDSHTSEGSTHCYGLICFQAYFVVCAMLACAAGLLTIPLLRSRTWRFFCRKTRSVICLSQDKDMERSSNLGAG